MPKRSPVPLPALILAMLVPMGGAFVYFVWSSGGVVTQAFFIAIKAFNWIFPLYFLRRTGWGGLWQAKEEFGKSVPLAKSVSIGLVFG